MTRRIGLLLIAVLVLSTAGCGGPLMLKHSPLTASAQAATPVALVIKDARAQEFGGGNDLAIGRLRNLGGASKPFNAGNSVTGAFKALFTDALAAGGFQVVDGSPVQIEVDISTFFMDGYVGYKIDSKIDVRVVSGGAVVHQAPIAEVVAFTYNVPGDLPEAFDQMMDKIAQDAVAIFNSAEVRTAIAPQ
ncbi:MAG: YajG family lipoprotein [Proteobacteria bacterium]|jgi:uncharacterized lipoprotein YajG|nr:YajG family lipoprotein [Pseudomonadota bacterium]